MKTQDVRARLLAGIADARREVRRLKVAAPYLFPEYGRVTDAERAVRAAQVEAFPRARP